MNDVAAFIDPIPNLEDDPSPSVVAVEDGRHACMPFPQMPGVVPNTDEHPATASQAGSHSREGCKNVVVAIEMWQSIIHCNDGTVSTSRCSLQCPHVVNAKVTFKST